MHVTMDRAGRVVIPKAVRDDLDLQPGVELELDIVDGHVVKLSRPTVPKRLVQRDGVWMAEADGEMPLLTDEMVRETLERVRR